MACGRTRLTWVLQGWYAADRGPANTLYVPGALLAPCANDIVVLELNRTSYLPGGATPAGAPGVIARDLCHGVSEPCFFGAICGLGAAPHMEDPARLSDPADDGSQTMFGIVIQCANCLRGL